MSIIVKGMEMPENCWECTGTGLNIGVSIFGGICPFCEKIRTDHDMETGRHPDCPLGALPDKHGRLVDADAFKADYGMKDDCADCEKEMRGKVMMCEYDRNYSKMDFCGWLDDAPTIVDEES